MKGVNIFIIGGFNSVNASLSEMIDLKEDMSVFTFQPDELSNNKYKLETKGKNIVLIDLQSINTGKLDIIRNIAHANRKSIIIVLDHYKTERMINPLMEAGAHGYLLNNTSEYEINNTINMMLYFNGEFRNNFKTFKSA
jgi:DNA-binding NarL/FixJ family response regulator